MHIFVLSLEVFVVNGDIVATSRVRWNIQEHSVNC